MNLTQCFVNLRSTCNAVNPALNITLGLVDSSGGLIQCPQYSYQAAGMQYSTCMEHCGKHPETFALGTFVQQFSAWLLPWLALISQLPFGAKHRVDNLMSMFLAVGSPMLAAYSLALTVLNGRWAARRFSGMTYPNSRYAFRILNNLQQTPIKIRDDGLLASLVILPQNDEWWKDLAERMEFTYTWSIAAATQIAWVLIAYVLTLADTFTSLPAQPGSGSDGLFHGQAIGSVWLWLLPVVFGWLQISPKCDDARVRRAVSRSNEIAYIATLDQRLPIKASAISALRAFSTRTECQDDNSLYNDQEKTPPIFNYARLLPWTQDVETVRAAYASASYHANRNQPVDESKEWIQVDGEILHPENRLGSLKQIKKYCAHPRPQRWGRDVGVRIFQATLAAILLQWGTSMAAFVIVFTTPTVGLGCRSGIYMLYAVTGTVVWAMLVVSSFLTHLVSTSKQSTYDNLTDSGSGVDTPEDHKADDCYDGTENLDNPTYYTYPPSLKFARLVAIILRRTAKILAFCNAIWIVLMNLLIFGKFFNTCACNRATFAPNIITRSFDTVIIAAGSVTSPWAGGVSLGLGSALLYVLFISIFINSSP